MNSDICINKTLELVLVEWDKNDLLHTKQLQMMNKIIGCP